MRKEQYLTLLVGLILVCLLYFAGKIKAPDQGMPDAQSIQLDFNEYESLQLANLPSEDGERIRSLKSKLITQPELGNYLELSQAWEAIGNYPLGAFYYYEAANLNSDSISWEAAGDKLYNGFITYGDSLISNNLITFAVASYEKAKNSEPDDLEVQMKLAETYVESPDPMKGILMLREIADDNPDYVPALMRLGRLSMETGQFDKAINRFQQVLKNEPINTEALYFLAISNEGIGNIEETIRLLELCKQLVANPAFTQEIDVYINELKK